jgi:hypothetical protein
MSGGLAPIPQAGEGRRGGVENPCSRSQKKADARSAMGRDRAGSAKSPLAPACRGGPHYGKARR